MRCGFQGVLVYSLDFEWSALNRCGDVDAPHDGDYEDDAEGKD